MARELRGKRGEQVHFPWRVVEPTEDLSYLEDADEDKIPMYLKKLYMKFAVENDFFIESGADLDKAELIANMAAKFGRKTIEVTLHGDHAPSLGVMTEWAQYIHDRPKEGFALVFNIDQAALRLVEALKSIIDSKVISGVKFDNYLVAVSATKGICQTNIRNNKPLFSLLKPAIECE